MIRLNNVEFGTTDGAIDSVRDVFIGTRLSAYERYIFKDPDKILNKLKVFKTKNLPLLMSVGEAVPFIGEEIEKLIKDGEKDE